MTDLSKGRGIYHMVDAVDSPDKGPGPPFGLIVARLHDKALDEAPKSGWTVMDMKKEWKVIYPFEK
jgi:hypothetical protein